MTFGASQTLMKGVTSSDEEARRIFDRALEAGINLVDTANVYNEGRSEELTGEWVAGKRDQLLIATKCRFPVGFGMTHKPGPQGDDDGLRGISSPPEDGRDRPLSGAHAGQKRCYRRDTAGAGRPRDRGEGSVHRLRQLRGIQPRRVALGRG